MYVNSYSLATFGHINPDWILADLHKLYTSRDQPDIIYYTSYPWNINNILLNDSQKFTDSYIEYFLNITYFYF